MATLRIPVGTFTVRHVQAMSRSDWRGGAFHRRYRDPRALREWTIACFGPPAIATVLEKQFNDGACGAAEWDWTPPREGSPIKARFTALGWDPLSAAHLTANVVITECRSSDT